MGSGHVMVPDATTVRIGPSVIESTVRSASWDASAAGAEAASTPAARRVVVKAVRMTRSLRDGDGTTGASGAAPPPGTPHRDRPATPGGVPDPHRWGPAPGPRRAEGASTPSTDQEAGHAPHHPRS